MRLWRLAPVLFSLALAACSGGPPPAPVVYKPLDYSYLPPIFLKVTSVSVQNGYVPDPDAAALISQAPEAPANALLDMANRRLVANGAPGTAAFTVETASINQAGGNLTGVMTVRLSVTSPDNRTTGYAEASVTNSVAAPDADDGPDKMRAALYDLTKRLMDSMNVQLQYQIQRNLGSWVSYSTNAAVAPLNSGGSSGGGIVATPLPGAVAPSTSPPAASPPASNPPLNVPSMIPPGFPQPSSSP
jgi:hypothetical protein